MVGSRATRNGLLLVTLLGVGCGGGTSFNGYGFSGGSAGSSGNASGGSAGAAGGNGGHAGTGTAGAGTGGYAAGAGIGVGGDVSYGGDLGIAGSYAGYAGTAGASTGGYAGMIGTAGVSTGGYAGTVGTAGSGGSDCTMLLAQASAALVAARECNPGVNALQCTGVISDICGCSYSVNSTGSAASQAYLTLTKQIHAQSCFFACTDIACPVVTNGTCQASTSSSLGGVCVAINGGA